MVSTEVQTVNTLIGLGVGALIGVPLLIAGVIGLIALLVAKIAKGVDKKPGAPNDTAATSDRPPPGP